MLYLISLLTIAIIKNTFYQIDISNLIETRTAISPQKKCCEMRGVPDKCMHACGGSTATIQSRGNPSCMNYMDVIENCRNGETMFYFVSLSISAFEYLVIKIVI